MFDKQDAIDPLGKKTQMRTRAENLAVRYLAAGARVRLHTCMLAESVVLDRERSTGRGNGERGREERPVHRCAGWSSWTACCCVCVCVCVCVCACVCVCVCVCVNARDLTKTLKLKRCRQLTRHLHYKDINL